MPKSPFRPLDELASFALLPDRFYDTTPNGCSATNLPEFCMGSRITAEQCRKYLDLQERRRTLQREADALERDAKAIEKELIGYLDGKGKTTADVACRAYRLVLTEGAAAVSWKDEFIRVTSPAEAERVLTGAPKRRKLNVMELSPAAA